MREKLKDRDGQIYFLPDIPLVNQMLSKLLQCQIQTISYPWWHYVPIYWGNGFGPLDHFITDLHYPLPRKMTWCVPTKQRCWGFCPAIIRIYLWQYKKKIYLHNNPSSWSTYWSVRGFQLHRKVFSSVWDSMDTSLLACKLRNFGLKLEHYRSTNWLSLELLAVLRGPHQWMEFIIQMTYVFFNFWFF